MAAKESSFRKAFYHLKMAEEYFNDAIRENPATLAAAVSKKYGDKIRWIMADFRTNPSFPSYAQDEFTKEMEGDLMFHERISEKCLLLQAKQKENVEDILDALLVGEKITVVLNEGGTY